MGRQMQSISRMVWMVGNYIIVMVAAGLGVFACYQVTFVLPIICIFLCENTSELVVICSAIVVGFWHSFGIMRILLKYSWVM